MNVTTPNPHGSKMTKWKKQYKHPLFGSEMPLFSTLGYQVANCITQALKVA